MDDAKPDQETEERPRIKVTDRRKFAADGTLRPDREDSAERQASEPPRGAERAGAPAEAAPAGATTPDEPSTADAAEPSTADIGEPPRTFDEDAIAGPEALGDDPSRIATPQPRISDLPRDFNAFVESMYFEALLYLGAIADPRTGQLAEDAELAKYKIDLLDMLQDKTAGNLTPEEKRQLDEVLYQLRMLYLQKTKAAKL